MAQLSVAYRAWSVPLEIDMGWAYWMRENLSVDGTKYSPELVHGWSPFRAAVIILFPVVLSLGLELVYASNGGCPNCLDHLLVRCHSGWK